MNGFKIWLLLVVSAQVLATRVAIAQVERGTERDYGWSVNSVDGVLEYIVQINPEKLAAMQMKSKMFPNGQETISDMPRELIGRASRVVIRIGNEILPRTPSIEELDRTSRITDPLNPTSTAMLPPGRMQDVESGVYNIQQQNAPPSLPALPSTLDSALSSRGGNLIDEASRAAGGLIDNVNALRNNATESLSDAIPAFPDNSALAQNMQQPAASDFLNSTRGGNTGAPSKFNSLPSNNPAAPSTNTAQGNPPFTNPNLTNPNLTNTNPAIPNRNVSNLGNSGAGGTTAQPGYPDPRLTPPSLSNQSTLTQQQTPAAGFGTSPGLVGRQNNTWNNSANNSAAPNYTAAPDPYANAQNVQSNYSGAPNNPFGTAPQTNPAFTNSQLNNSLSNPNYDRMAMNNTPPPSTQVSNPNLNNQTSLGRGTSLPAGSSPPSILTGSTTSPELAQSTKIDGVLQVLFLLSLVVNFYLGILIRKLLIRYRSLLTNVRQSAYA